MSEKCLNGKKIATEIKTEIKNKIDFFLQKGFRNPNLAVILIGENPASLIYIKNKIKACNELGILSSEFIFAEISIENLLDLIQKLNCNPKIDGILVQLPVPKNLNENQILDAISPEKDVDGFHPENLGKLFQNRPNFRACTPFGIITLLQKYQINAQGKNALIIGASNIVGKPMIAELLALNATVSIAHIFTQNLPDLIKQADILIVAIGDPKFVKGEWIKKDAIVIDVGINRLDSGKIVGDVDFDSAYKNVRYITPVPGGIGPMTVAMLMQNTLQSYEKRVINKK